MENKKCYGNWGQDIDCFSCDAYEFCYQMSTGDTSFDSMIDIEFEHERGDIDEQLVAILGTQMWRERAIIMLVLQRAKNIEIALAMQISERLVVAIITRIRKRFPRIGHAIACMRPTSRLKKKRVKS